MRERTNLANSTENIHSINRNRENFSILKGIDEDSFDKLVKSFGNEKDENKVLISGFLNNTKTKLIQLGDMKIDINHIKNYVWNKPDISKDLERKIAKLYLKKLYDSCVEDDVIISKLNNAFNIDSEKWEKKIEKQKLRNEFNALDPSQVTFFLRYHGITLKDLEDNEDDKNEHILKEIKAIIDNDKRDIDFKTIKIDVNKLEDIRNEKLNSTTISNNEIFDLIGSSINKITDFQSQTLESQQIILDLLQFEVKDIISDVQLWGMNTERDMKSFILPANNASEIFDEAKDSEILQLNLEKSAIEDILNRGEKGIATKDKTFWKDYINRLEKQGLPAEYIKKLKHLLLGKIEYHSLKNNLKKRIESINKQIWRKYIENFEKLGKNPELINTLKNFYSNNFDCSKLNPKEQTILWQNLITSKIDKKENSWAKHIGLDQDGFKDFLETLYDFEKDNLLINIDGIGRLNLKIKRDVASNEGFIFSDVENFKNMDEINPIKFTVNIDDNDENIIKDLEETKDSPLRVDGIMETHITKGGELNIGNGYKLEICGKVITKSQFDELLECDYDEDELNKKLKNLGLYDELKDFAISVKKKMFSPENVYNDYDENGVAQNNDGGYGPYGYRFCIFKEMLKSLDVKVVERNLIFAGKNVDKLSQIYIMSKLGGNIDSSRSQDKKATDLMNAAYEAEELGDEDSGKARAEEIWNDIKGIYEDEYKYNKGEEEYESFSIDSFDDGSTIYDNAKKYRDSLNDEGKKSFREKLIELCKTDPSIEEDDRSDVLSDVSAIIDYLENPHITTSSDDGTDNSTLAEETEEEKFKRSWDSLQGDKECPVFGVGTRLYFDLGESQLPPMDITDAEKSFYCFKIESVDDINQTFTLKAIGGDLPSSLTGNVYTLKKSQLESMKKGGSVYKVRADDQRDRKSCIESINKAGFFKKFTTFGNMEGQVKMKGDKFVNEKGEEIKYFDRVEGVFDDSNTDKSKWGQGEKIYKYEIKGINTSKGTVKLASRFDSHDEKTYEDIQCEYENEIPFEQFILLMEGKRLKGYTQKQQNEMETKYNIDDPKRLALKGKRVKWFSIGSIVNVFKNTTKAIKAKIDERNKEGEADFENWLLSDEGFNLYGKLSPLLGDAAKKLQYEFYTNRENRTRKKIEERYKIFETDPQYSEFFSDHLLAILDRKGYVGNDKDRYKFAAAFLVMVKKEGPYPRAFANQKSRGKRVENILGPEHKIRFLNFYNKKKNEIEQEKDLGHQSGARLALQEELNKMEIQYIISTIDGRAPYGPASNEYMLKSIWSKNFMSKLEENINGYYNNHQAEKEKLQTFYAAEESYLRNIGSGKFQAALPALERMCEKAKTPGEVFRIKGYLLGAMLMGIIKNNSTASTIKSFWSTCRAIGFTPGYRMRDIEQQDKVKALLDGITNGEFSKDTKFNISDFEPGNIKDGKYSYGKTFQGYWNSHGEDILWKIQDPTYKGGSKSIVDLANEKDNPNNYIFKDIIKNSTTNEIDSMNKDAPPIFAQESPLTATSNMVKDFIPRNGKYSKLKSEEDVSNAEDFWTKASDVIPSADCESNQETVNFMFKKFFNWFDDVLTTETQKMILRSLPLIKEEAKTSKNNARYMLWYMLKGNMHDKTHGAFPTEFNQVVDKFVDFFDKNIQKINESTIKTAFDDNDVIKSFSNPYVLLGLKKFYSKYMNGRGKDRTNYKKNADLSLLKLKDHKRRDDTINDKIEELRKRTKEYGIPNIPFGPNSPQTIIVGDLSNHDVEVEMGKLGESRY